MIDGVCFNANNSTTKRCSLVVDHHQLATATTSNDELIKNITSQLETKTGEDDSASETAKDDWMLAARVVDRLCFIAFSVCLVVGTTAVLLTAMYA